MLEGRIRFEVEKPDRTFEVFEATKGSYVFVPERMLHSFEVVGNRPAISFEVTLASATPVYPDRPAEATPGVEYIPVRLSTGPNPLDVPEPNGKPWPIHFNVYDLATQNDAKKNWTQEAIRKNRARGNLICGHGRIRSTRGPEQPRAFPLGLRRVLGGDARRAALDVRGRCAGLDRRRRGRHRLRAAEDVARAAILGQGGAELSSDQQHVSVGESFLRSAAVIAKRSRAISTRDTARSPARPAGRTFASTASVSPFSGSFSEYSTSLTVPHGGPSAPGSKT